MVLHFRAALGELVKQVRPTLGQVSKKIRTPPPHTHTKRVWNSVLRLLAWALHSTE